LHDGSLAAPSLQDRSRLTAGREILAATATVTALSIAVKAATGARELLVAWLFGTSDAVDAYLIAYAVPYFLITVVAGALPSVLVPAYLRVRHDDGAPAAELLLSSAVVIAAVVLVPLSVLLAMWAPGYLPLLASRFMPEKLALTAQLAIILAPTLATSTLISLLAAALNAHRRFTLAAVSPIVTTLVAIASLIWFGSMLGIGALALGVLFGNVLELAILLMALRVARVHIRLPATGVHQHVRGLWAPLAQTLAGSVLMASTLLVDQAMAAALQPGSAAVLNYAMRLVMLPLSLTAAALGTVVLPHFSTMAAQGAWRDIQQVLGRYLRLIFAACTAIGVVLIALASPLVQLLLERGSFSPEATATVAPTVAALAIQIPFYTATIVLMRVAAALRLTAQIALASAVNVVVNVAFNYWLSSFLGVAGIALSTSLVYVSAFALLLLAVRARLTAAVGQP
jgi:putative peptidoglycan lipid II flippase